MEQALGAVGVWDWTRTQGTRFGAGAARAAAAHAATAAAVRAYHAQPGAVGAGTHGEVGLLTSFFLVCLPGSGAGCEASTLALPTLAKMFALGQRSTVCKGVCTCSTCRGARPAGLASAPVRVSYAARPSSSSRSSVSKSGRAQASSTAVAPVASANGVAPAPASKTSLLATPRLSSECTPRFWPETQRQTSRSGRWALEGL